MTELINYNGTILPLFGFNNCDLETNVLIEELEKVYIHHKLDIVNDNICKYISFVKNIKNIPFIKYISYKDNAGDYLYHKILIIYDSTKELKHETGDIYSIKFNCYGTFNKYILLNDNLFKALNQFDDNKLYIMKVDKVILPYFHNNLGRLVIGPEIYYRINTSSIKFQFPIYVCNNQDGILEPF